MDEIKEPEDLGVKTGTPKEAYLQHSKKQLEESIMKEEINLDLMKGNLVIIQELIKNG